MDKLKVEGFCHICGASTEFTCDRCDEPVCEDCCTPMTYHNQIDYPLCTVCHEGIEARRSLEYWEEKKKQDAIKAKKDAANAKARANYWKPENIEKRRLAKEKRKEERREQARKDLEEAKRIVGEMFRGMF